jgi:hypothetical protein
MPTLTNRVARMAVYVVVDIVAMGMGMGLPIFAILFGFPVGWLLPTFLGIASPCKPGDLRAILRAALLASAVTFAVAAGIWLPTLIRLAGPPGRIANFGIPMILYEPLPSFIGWIVLMVVVSPFLQLLAIVFGSVLHLAVTRVVGE